MQEAADDQRHETRRETNRDRAQAVESDPPEEDPRLSEPITQSAGDQSQGRERQELGESPQFGKDIRTSPILPVYSSQKASSDSRPAAVLMGKTDLSMDRRHRLAQVLLKPVDIDLAACHKADFLGSW